MLCGSAVTKKAANNPHGKKMKKSQQELKKGPHSSSPTAVSRPATPSNVTSQADEEAPKQYYEPHEVLERFHASLSEYEKAEILEYSRVYFFGKEGIPKSKVTMDDKGQAKNYGFDDKDGVYKIVIGDHIAYRYEIVKLMGKGSFANVIKAFDHKKRRFCAVKIVRNEKRYSRLLQREVNILHLLRQQDDRNTFNVVHMMDYLKFREHHCVVFEELSMNLYELNRLNKYKGFEMKIVRKFGQAILKALEAFQVNQIIHADLKPENILLKAKNRTGVKVIDFGWSCYQAQKPLSLYVQSRYYRAPEIILGGPYTPAIDMWSFGCIVAEMATGYPIFPGDDTMDQLAVIIEMLGTPPIKVLSKYKANLVAKSFSVDHYPTYCTVAQYKDLTVLYGKTNKSGNFRGAPGSKPLEVYLGRHSQSDKFVDFLLRCFEWDPEQRMTPIEALKHVWTIQKPEIECAAELLDSPYEDIQITDPTNFHTLYGRVMGQEYAKLAFSPRPGTSTDNIYENIEMLCQSQMEGQSKME